MPSLKQLLVIALGAAIVTAACGDGSSGPVRSPTTTKTTQSTATTTGSSSETAAAQPSSATTTVPTTTTVTTEPAPDDALSAIASAELSDTVAPLSDPLLGGSPDYRSAAAIAADVANSGVDLTGVEFWVIPVTGTEERLLVMEISENAVGLLEDPSGESAMDALLGAPSLEASGATRLVINYYGTDAEGDFVLTTTVPIDVLITAMNEGGDAGDQVQFQFSRNGEVVEG